MSHDDAVSIIKQGGNKIALTVKRSSETISKLYMSLLNCQISVNITSYKWEGLRSVQHYAKFRLGSNRNNITTDIEPSFISELKDQLKGSADDKDESSLPHPSRLYYNYNLVYIKLMFFSVSIICRVYDNNMITSDHRQCVNSEHIQILNLYVMFSEH